MKNKTPVIVAALAGAGILYLMAKQRQEAHAGYDGLGWGGFRMPSFNSVTNFVKKIPTQVGEVFNGMVKTASGAVKDLKKIAPNVVTGSIVNLSTGGVITIALKLSGPWGAKITKTMQKPFKDLAARTLKHKTVKRWLKVKDVSAEDDGLVWFEEPPGSGQYASMPRADYDRLMKELETPPPAPVEDKIVVTLPTGEDKVMTKGQAYAYFKSLLLDPGGGVTSIGSYQVKSVLSGPIPSGEDLDALMNLHTGWGVYVRPNGAKDWIGPVRIFEDREMANKQADIILKQEADKLEKNNIKQRMVECQARIANATWTPGTRFESAEGVFVSGGNVPAFEIGYGCNAQGGKAGALRFVGSPTKVYVDHPTMLAALQKAAEAQSKRAVSEKAKQDAAAAKAAVAAQKKAAAEQALAEARKRQDAAATQAAQQQLAAAKAAEAQAKADAEAASKATATLESGRAQLAQQLQTSSAQPEGAPPLPVEASVQPPAAPAVEELPAASVASPEPAPVSEGKGTGLLVGGGIAALAAALALGNG